MPSSKILPKTLVGLDIRVIINLSKYISFINWIAKIIFCLDYWSISPVFLFRLSLRLSPFVRPSVSTFQNQAKSFAARDSGLAEWIIDDICLVIIVFKRKAFSTLPSCNVISYSLLSLKYLTTSSSNSFSFLLSQIEKD